MAGKLGAVQRDAEEEAQRRPDAIPVEMCYLGWQDSLRNLASLVEPEINQ
jgi:hypothetical protein